MDLVVAGEERELGGERCRVRLRRGSDWVVRRSQGALPYERMGVRARYRNGRTVTCIGSWDQVFGIYLGMVMLRCEAGCGSTEQRVWMTRQTTVVSYTPP